MKVAIVGGRDFSDRDLFYEACTDLHLHTFPDRIISGGAKGADSLAREFASKYGIPFEEYLPDWKTRGKAAGPLRNADIVNKSDVVVAFWNGVSKGTRSTITLALATKKELHVIPYERTE